MSAIKNAKAEANRGLQSIQHRAPRDTRQRFSAVLKDAVWVLDPPLEEIIKEIYLKYIQEDA